MLYTLTDSAGAVRDIFEPSRWRAMARAHAQAAALSVAAIPAWQVAAFAAIVGLQTLAIALHQPWSDEYQAWLIALQSSPATLLHNMRNEGHPVLWHAMLMAVQTVSSDPAAMKVVQWIVAAAVTALILARAPFAPWLRVALALNYYCLFEYTVIGRSYSLGLLLWILALVTWRHWSVWIWLALMMHVSAHFQWLAGLLVLYRSATLGTNWRAMLAVGTSALLALASMWPAPDTVAASKPAGVLFAIVSLGAIVTPLTAFGAWFGWAWSAALMMLCNLAGLSAMLYAALRLFPRDLVRTGLVGLMLGLVLAFGAWVYPVYPRHFGVAVLFVIALAWLGGLTAWRARAVFTTLATAWAVQGLAAVGLSFTQAPFSAGTEAAQWIVRNGLAEARWAAGTGLTDTSFVAVTGRSIFSLEQGCHLRYHRWNRKDRPIAPALANARLAGAADATGRIYLMTETRLKFRRLAERQMLPQTDLDWNGLETAQARELAAFGPDTQGKTVRLYEVVPRADNIIPAQPCT
jgi:hypothetical protein